MKQGQLEAYLEWMDNLVEEYAPVSKIINDFQPAPFICGSLQRMTCVKSLKHMHEDTLIHSAIVQLTQEKMVVLLACTRILV